MPLCGLAWALSTCCWVLLDPVEGGSLAATGWVSLSCCGLGVALLLLQQHSLFTERAPSFRMEGNCYPHALWGPCSSHQSLPRGSPCAHSPSATVATLSVSGLPPFLCLECPSLCFWPVCLCRALPDSSALICSWFLLFCYTAGTCVLPCSPAVTGAPQGQG